MESDEVEEEVEGGDGVALRGMSIAYDPEKASDGYETVRFA